MSLTLEGFSTLELRTYLCRLIPLIYEDCDPYLHSLASILQNILLDFHHLFNYLAL